MKSLTLLASLAVATISFAQDQTNTPPTQQVVQHLFKCGEQVSNDAQQLTKEEFVFNIAPGNGGKKPVIFDGFTFSHPDKVQIYYYGTGFTDANGGPKLIKTLWVGRSFYKKTDDDGPKDDDYDDGGNGSNGQTDPDNQQVQCTVTNSGNSIETCRRGPVLYTYNPDDETETGLTQIVSPNPNTSLEDHLYGLFRGLLEDEEEYVAATTTLKSGLFRLKLHLPKPSSGKHVCQIKIVFTDEETQFSVFDGMLRCPTFNCNPPQVQAQINSCGDISLPEFQCSQYLASNVSWYDRSNRPIAERVSSDYTFQADRVNSTYKYKIEYQGQYSNTADGKCIHQGEITATDIFDFNLDVETAPSCNGEKTASATLTLNENYSGSNPVQFTISNQSSNRPISQVYNIAPGVKTQSLTDLTTGVYQVKGKAGQCEKIKYIPILPKTFEFEIQSSQNLTCHNSNDGQINATIIAEGVNISSPENIEVFWEGPTLPQDQSVEIQTLSDLKNISLSNLAAGEYKLNVFDMASGCEAQKVIQITQPQPLIANYVPLHASCNGGQGTLAVNVTGGNADSLNDYSVYNRQTRSNLQFNSNSGNYEERVNAGVYDLIISDKGQKCETRLRAGIIEESITAKMYLEGRGCKKRAEARAYIYSPTGELLTDYIVQNTKFDTTEQKYVNYNGCSIPTKLELNGNTPYDKIPVYIPNAFSPNNDGINDVFEAYTMPHLKDTNISMRIFDRWGGEMLYESIGSTFHDLEGWNGLFGNYGDTFNSGVYVYVIQVGDECGSLYKGDINLVR